MVDRGRVTNCEGEEGEGEDEDEVGEEGDETVLELACDCVAGS